MDHVTSNISWTEDRVKFLREKYLELLSGTEIIDAIEAQFGIRPSPSSIRLALNRHCHEETSRVAAEKRKAFEANRARAAELIDAGRTAYEAAEIMGVPVHRIYDWVPTYERPSSAHTFGMFESYLRSQTPSVVPEDPIVDGGKLITDLGQEDCRWPIGKDADGAFRFCGCKHHQTRRVRPYCEKHSKLDARPPNPAPVPTSLQLVARAKFRSLILHSGATHATVDLRSMEENVPETIKVAA